MEKVEESDELAKFGTRDGGSYSCTKTLGEEITPSIVPFCFRRCTTVIATLFFCLCSF
jgi:hypothetical protein